MDGLSGDLYRGNTVSLNCLKCLTLNSSLCFVNFLMTIFYKTIIGLCQLFILILIIIYFVFPLFILFPNLFYQQLKIKIQTNTYKDLAIGALRLFSRIKRVQKSLMLSLLNRQGSSGNRSWWPMAILKGQVSG